MVMVWGWVVVGEPFSFWSSSNQSTYLLSACFTMLVGLAMAGNETYVLKFHPNRAHCVSHYDHRDLQVRNLSIDRPYIPLDSITPVVLILHPAVRISGLRCSLGSRTRH